MDGPTGAVGHACGARVPCGDLFVHRLWVQVSTGADEGSFGECGLCGGGGSKANGGDGAEGTK